MINSAPDVDSLPSLTDNRVHGNKCELELAVEAGKCLFKVSRNSCMPLHDFYRSAVHSTLIAFSSMHGTADKVGSLRPRAEITSSLHDTWNIPSLGQRGWRSGKIFASRWSQVQSPHRGGLNICV